MTPLTVLVTRPRETSTELVAQITALGHKPLVEPMIDINFLEKAPLTLNGVQAIALTSANGALAAAKLVSDRRRPVFAVGPTTAKVAADQSFEKIFTSPGQGVEDLAQFIADSLNPADGEILHIRSDRIQGDLGSLLQRRAFRTRSEIGYIAKGAQSLSPELIEVVRIRRLQAAMFFSPRTLRIFLELSHQNNLTPHLKSVAGLMLSQNIADSVAPDTFRKSLIATTTTVGAMMDLLKNC